MRAARFLVPLVLFLSLVGCTKSLKCKNGTLFIDVTLTGSAAQTSQLILYVSIVGVTTSSPIPVTHKPGASHGGLEIDFPHGYPAGHDVFVTVGTYIDGIEYTQAAVFHDLEPGCAAAAITINGPGSDLSMDDFRTVDLGATDGALPVDMALPDGAAVDLSRVDLQCTPTKEECFDGIDNDCDGLVDCADTVDCPSSVAVCAPKVAGAEYGAAFGGVPLPVCASVSHDLYGNLPDPPYGCGGCASNISNPTVAIESDSTLSCSSTTQSNVVATVGGTCTGPINLAYQWGNAPISATCSTPTAPSVPAISVRTDEFCQSTSVGGGCGSTQVCVPYVADPCVQVPSTTSCASTGYTKAYAPNSGSWYLSYSDTRGCNGDCSTPTVNETVVDVYNAAGCGAASYVTEGNVLPANQDYNGCIAPGPYYFELAAGNLYCGSDSPLTGTLTRTSPVNVCCIN